MEKTSISDPVFGFSTEAWQRAKREAICAIVRAGRRDEVIAYSDLASAISSIHFEPHDFAINQLLDEISKEEEAAGRGVLTALVVFKDERGTRRGLLRDGARHWPVFQ